MPKDTRELFDAFTTNNPSTWHRARTVVVDALNRAQVQALKDLPVIDIERAWMPLDDCDMYPSECIVRRGWKAMRGVLLREH